MCIAFLLLGYSKEVPFILAFNRDEYLNRYLVYCFLLNAALISIGERMSQVTRLDARNAGRQARLIFGKMLLTYWVDVMS